MVDCNCARHCGTRHRNLHNRSALDKAALGLDSTRPFFLGAVEQHLIAGSISWFTALKAAIFAAVFAGLAGVRGDKES